MKSLFAMALVLCSASAALATPGALDGKKFCRTIATGGVFGRPRGVGQHCVSFENGEMTDNANTFFGNPPERIQYALVGGVIIDAQTSQPTDYVVSNDEILYGDQKVEMKEQPATP